MKDVYDLERNRLIRLHCTEWDSLEWGSQRRNDIQTDFVDISEKQAKWMFLNRSRLNWKFPFVSQTKSVEELVDEYAKWRDAHRKLVFDQLRKQDKYVGLSDDEIVSKMIRDTVSKESLIERFAKDKKDLETTIRAVAHKGKVPVSEFYRNLIDPELWSLIEFCPSGNCSACQYMRPKRDKVKS